MHFIRYRYGSCFVYTTRFGTPVGMQDFGTGMSSSQGSPIGDCFCSHLNTAMRMNGLCECRRLFGQCLKDCYNCGHFMRLLRKSMGNSCAHISIVHCCIPSLGKGRGRHLLGRYCACIRAARNKQHNVETKCEARHASRTWSGQLLCG